jgi:uncharacterized membrane protein YeaQ/YmgE (transglycosylase-associated protein family)
LPAEATLGRSGLGTFVILGALAGWFTGRTLRTGGLVVAYVLLGVAGALVGGFILSFTLSLPAAACFSPLLLPRQAEPYRCGSSN